MFSQIVIVIVAYVSGFVIFELFLFLSDTPEKILSLLLVSNNKIWYRRSLLELCI